MKFLFGTLIFIFLSGCATTGNYTARLDTWIGSPIDRLISSWGIPDATYPLNGGKLVMYRRDGGSNSNAMPIGNMYYINTTNYSCETTFNVDASGIIRDYQFKGNSCVASSPPPQKEEKKEELVETQPREPNFWTAGLSYNFANSMFSDTLSVQVSNTNTKGSSKAENESGAGVNLDYLISTSDPKIKLDLGIFYDFPRSINSMTYNLNGNNLTTKLSTAKISNIGALVGLVYSIDNNYILGSLNVSKSEISGVTGETVSTTPGIGAQLGYGFKINPRIWLEAVYKSISFYLDEKPLDGSYFAKHDTVISRGFQLQVRYSF